MADITLTIHDLYDRVWTQPIDLLSRELGLSNVGLAKLCRRHGIPVPGRGFWRRRQTGHRVTQVPLPGSVDATRIITFPGPAPASPADGPISAEHLLVTFERDPTNRIDVPDDLRATHRLIRATREAWTQTKRGERTTSLRLAITVQPPSIPRALRIMQALLTACDARGFVVSLGKDGTSDVAVLDERIRFGLDERSKQVPHVLTADERRRRHAGRCGACPNGI